MKKVLPFLSLIIICLLLTSCGSSSLKGDLTSYSSTDGSFSIELPAEKEDSWISDSESPENTLDISNKNDTVNIKVQCLSKNQAGYIAHDLESYRDYAMVNILGDILTESDLNEAEIKPADFITNSEAYEYSLKDGISGMVMFMESNKCYYMYFVMAVDKYFGSNEKIFTESISSLKELTDPDMSKDDTDSSGSDK